MRREETHTSLTDWSKSHAVSYDVILSSCDVIVISLFHRTFSKALDRYADMPERIGECFMQHVSHMTSLYGHMTSHDLVSRAVGAVPDVFHLL